MTLRLCFFFALLLSVASSTHGQSLAQDAPLLEAKEIEFRGEARARLRAPEEEGSLSERVQGWFRVDSVECEGNIRLKCNVLAENLKSAGALDYQNLSLRELGIPFARGSSSVERFLKRDPWIESSTIIVSPFRRRAILRIQEAIPWFVTDLRGQTWVVSRRGALLQELRSIQDPGLTVEVSQLPRVRGIEVRGADSVMREAERIRLTAALLGSIEESGRLPFDVESFELLEDGSLAITPFDALLPTVFFKGDSPDEARGRLRVLREVIADLQRRGERVSKIDLRVGGRAVVSP